MTSHSSDRHAQAPSKTRFIFVTGGVVSSLGKGIAAASIGRLLVARGLSLLGLGRLLRHRNAE